MKTSQRMALPIFMVSAAIYLASPVSAGNVSPPPKPISSASVNVDNALGDHRNAIQINTTNSTAVVAHGSSHRPVKSVKYDPDNPPKNRRNDTSSINPFK